MSYLVDYHIHTSYSDGNDSYLNYLKEAQKKDLAEIGFSDHITLAPVDWCVRDIDYPVLRENLKKLCDDFSEDVQVRFGLEVDYFPEKEKEIQQVISYFPTDYVIGSVHFLGDWNFDIDKSLYGKWTNDTLYQNYFEILQKAAKSNLFDIVGHFDIIKKLNCWPESDQSNLFEETLKIIKEANLVIELNTSGLDRPCGEFFPNQKIMELAYKLGIPITLGSDAHRPEQVARHFDSAISLLKQIGFTKITRFRNRHRSEIEI